MFENMLHIGHVDSITHLELEMDSSDIGRGGEGEGGSRVKFSWCSPIKKVSTFDFEIQTKR